MLWKTKRLFLISKAILKMHKMAEVFHFMVLNGREVYKVVPLNRDFKKKNNSKDANVPPKYQNFA